MEIQRRDSDYSPTLSFPTDDEYQLMMRMAGELVKSGFMPKAIDTVAKAFAVMLKGRELGIAPMQALGNIAIINGKPTIQAELMMALVKRAYGRDVIWIESSNDKSAKVGYLVHGEKRFYTFTIEMARKAGLLDRRDSNWDRYPDAMLRARVVSAVCRMEFPEVIGGMYVPGELGDQVRVNESTGEIITVEVNSPTRQQPAPQRQEPKAAPQSAPPAQVGAGNVDRSTGDILDAKVAEPVPARGNRPAPAPEKVQQRRETTEDKKIREQKQSLARLAENRGVDSRLPEILEEKYGKPAGDLTYPELQEAYSWLSTASSTDLARKANSTPSNPK